MASRFMTFAAFTYLFSAAAALWNTVGIFGISNGLVDNTNTIGGVFNSIFCTANSSGVITSCTNQMLIVMGVITVLTLGTGLVTIMAFGNTYMAFGIFLSFVPCIATLYDSIVGVMDMFGINGATATGIGGLFVIVMTITFAAGVIQIQSKVPI